MKTYVKYVLIAVVAGLGIFLFYLSAAAWGNLIATKEKVMFYLEQPISVREADGIEKQIREEKENNGQQESRHDKERIQLPVLTKIHQGVVQLGAPAFLGSR